MIKEAKILDNNRLLLLHTQKCMQLVTRHHDQVGLILGHPCNLLH